MKTTRISRERTLVNNVPNEGRARKESEGVKQLVNLDKRTSVLQRNGDGRRQTTYHRICYIWVDSPDVPFHEK